MKTVADLHEEAYLGHSVRSILMNPEFREKVLNDKTVRGNDRAKEFVMDKLAVGGKVLITGPTGEAKTLFARVLIDHIIREVNSAKWHISGCPFNEDAGYLTNLLDHYAANMFESIEVLQSLSPFSREKIEQKLAEKTGEPVYLDNSSQMIKLGPKIVVDALKEIEVEKTLVRRSQLDPRSDPESLYMLLAGVENLEELFSSSSSSTYAASTHKVGSLSQGFVIVNEIQRLPLTLLEAMMGFLEEPLGVKYSIQGQAVYLDGAVIFTSNAPLTVFGEESQPIINRVPEVLWPARNLDSRTQIVKDMFNEQLTLSQFQITPNPAVIKMFSLAEVASELVSRLAVEFVSYVAGASIPDSLKLPESARSESRMTRAKFYAGMDDIHNPQKTPHIDLRTLNNLIGEAILRLKISEDKTNVLTLEHMRSALDVYDVPSHLINDGLQEVKVRLRNHLRAQSAATSVQEVESEVGKMKALSDEDINELIVGYEGLEKHKEEARAAIITSLFSSYEQLLRVDYI